MNEKSELVLKAICNITMIILAIILFAQACQMN